MHGEGLADKGFEHCDMHFANFNKVRFPRVLRNRDSTQYDVVELITKVKHCELRHTSEVECSFFENVDAVKDAVIREK